MSEQHREDFDDSDLTGDSITDTDLALMLGEWVPKLRALEAEQFKLIQDRLSSLNISLDHDSAFSTPANNGWLRMIATKHTISSNSPQAGYRTVDGYRLIINRVYTVDGENDHNDVSDYMLSYDQKGSILRRSSLIAFDRTSGRWQCGSASGPFIYSDKEGKSKLSVGAGYTRSMSKYNLSPHDLRSTHLLLEELAPFSIGMSDPI